MTQSYARKLRWQASTFLCLSWPFPRNFPPDGVQAGQWTQPQYPKTTRIYVDADACPVKDEIYRVASRLGVPVSVVAGHFIRVPQDPLIERIAAGSGMDAADDWIAERAGDGDIVITSDIPLASRCVKAGAEVIAPNGKPFSEALDRHDAGGAEPDDGFALIGRDHGRTEIILAARPLHVPVRARPNHPPHSAPPRRAGRGRSRLIAMAPPLIQLKDIKLTFGGTPLLSGVELSVSTAERVCLIGRNGSGKSTLLKIAAGLVEVRQRHAASCSPAPPSAICRRSRILPALPPRWPMSRRASAPATTIMQARYVLEQLGLHGDEDPAHSVRRRSRRAALARVLAPSPDILLLDEPTNHLDLHRHRMAGE